MATPDQPDFTGSITVNDGNPQEVNWTATGPVTVANEILQTGPGPTIGPNSLSVNVSSGGSINIGSDVPPGIYDQAFILLYSPGGNLGNITIGSGQIRLSAIVSGGPAIWWGFNAVGAASGQGNDNSDECQIYGPIDIPTATSTGIPLPMSYFLAFAQTSVAINETMQYMIFLRYASKRITNISSDPGQIQTAQGEYDTITPFSITVNAGATGTILAAGNYVKQLRLTVQQTAANGTTGYTVSVVFGSTDIDYCAIPASSPALTILLRDEYNFGPDGAYNQGISVSNASGAPPLTISGFVVTSSVTPASKVSSVS